MQLSQIPTKFYKAFGASASPGNIRPIPVTAADPNAASQTTGWPANAFAPVGAGGVPPDGRDMNGLDNMLSAWAQWLALGGAFVPYDATFQAAVGGYPKWSIVNSLATPGTYWQSTADNNTTNPDASGAGWQAWPTGTSIPWSAPPAIGNVTPSSGKFTTLIATGSFNAAGIVSGSDLQINGVGFSQSFGTSGYQRLPSGLIMQFGRFVSATGNGDVINFPLSFPSNCAIATSMGTTSSANLNTCNIELNAGPAFTSFQAWTWVNGSITAGQGVGWVAVGN